MRELTYQESIRTRGIIYLIQNQYDKKGYVGKTTNTFNTRYSGGKWWTNSSNRAANILLSRVVEKYGHEQFKIFILEDGLTDKLLIKERERFWAEQLNTYAPNGYNIRACGEGGEFYGPQGQESKRISREKRIKTYFLKNIERQKIIEINDLEKWCKENNLKPTHIRNVLCGLVIISQGYCLPETDEKSMIPSNCKKYKVKYIPTGEIIEITYLSRFCNENNISLSCFRGMLNGKYKRVKNFCLPETDLRTLLVKKAAKPNDSLCWSKYYNMELLDSKGNIHVLDKKIRIFCKENHLVPSGVYAVLTKKIAFHKGWRLKNISKEELEELTYKKGNKIYYFLVDSQIIKIDNLRYFCRKLNLNRSSIRDLLNRKINSFKGISLPSYEDIQTFGKDCLLFR